MAPELAVARRRAPVGEKLFSTARPVDWCHAITIAVKVELVVPVEGDNGAIKGIREALVAVSEPGRMTLRIVVPQ